MLWRSGSTTFFSAYKTSYGHFFDLLTSARARITSHSCNRSATKFFRRRRRHDAQKRISGEMFHYWLRIISSKFCNMENNFSITESWKTGDHSLDKMSLPHSYVLFLSSHPPHFRTVLFMLKRTLRHLVSGYFWLWLEVTVEEKGERKKAKKREINSSIASDVHIRRGEEKSNDTTGASYRKPALSSSKDIPL